VQAVTTSTALVLAGGGVAGIAWELGVLRGLADVDPGLADRVLAADLVVGTSAGSSVAAQITSGVPLEELYEAQLRPETAEIEVDVDLAALVARVNAAMQGAAGTEDAGRRIGALALATPTIDPALRRAAIDARLPVKTWPQRRVLVPAVDAESGELAVFSRDSGVALVDAVAASCAVPGVWPTVEIDGRRYMDGGTRSMANSDLAAGADRVLVVLPTRAGRSVGAAEAGAVAALWG
jgi:NTE family protein